ncbi:hypothetical protein [Enterobacter asburiae]|uniref:hypothetical protein n=1 Tax=Enterobacter asburiae TaxID=61645 RepID=UPI001E540F8F|nr:hypothetical protein [Enterobacter asburiae]MCE2003117.1 hypothetical protein [Enterobacter asburiae]
MKTSQTKTPASMLEDVLAEVDEARTLLSTIMRNSPDDEKTDSALACLIRSLERTLQTGYEYIDNSPAPLAATINDISDAVLATKKLEALIQITHESFVSTKNEDEHLSLMLSSIWDYANEVGNELRSVQQKLS